MFIGDKLQGNIVNMTEITNIVSVKHNDDGQEEWYEIVDPVKSDQMAIIGKDIVGNEIAVIIKKDENNISLLSDLM